MASGSPYVSANEAAELFGVSGETLRRLYRSGRIPAYRVGRYLRFAPDELADAFRDSTASATAPTAAVPNFDALGAA